MSIPSRYTSMAEAAMRLHVTYGRVRDLICQGRLKARQVAGRYSTWLVDAVDLERLVRERRKAAR